jgi:hypothetical protein
MEYHAWMYILTFFSYNVNAELYDIAKFWNHFGFSDVTIFSKIIRRHYTLNNEFLMNPISSVFIIHGKIYGTQNYAHKTVCGKNLR